MEVKVSVVVPVYNVEKYLRQCLDSVVNQTLKEIEIICVNDGSTDSSLSILKEYEVMDKRINVIDQVNCGAGNARNKGIDIANGEYLYFLDGDDWLDLNALDILYSRAKKTNAEVVMFLHNKFDNQTLKIVTHKRFDQISHLDVFSVNDVNDKLVDILTPTIWDKFYLYSFVKERNIWFQDLRACNDVYFALASVAIASKLTCVAKPLITWRMNQKTGITSKRGCFWRDAFTAFDKLLLDLAELLKNNNNLWNEFYQRYLRTCLYEYRFVSGDEKKIFVETARKKLPHENFVFFLENIFHVSVIIPVYNVEKYLHQCLDTIINQTLKEIEIICVNDGSTDTSLKILREYEKQDERIVVIDQDNMGLGGARNSGIDVARGEYIGFVDSDDFVDFDYYEKLYDIAKTQNADLARASYKYYYSYDRCYESSLGVVIAKKSEAKQWLNVNEHDVVVWNAIYKKDFLTKNLLRFDVSHKINEDVLFTTKAVFYSSKSLPVSGTYYYYRRYANISDSEQVLSNKGIYDVNNFIHVNQDTMNFIDSVEYKTTNDYTVAYKRCLWRFDDRMKRLYINKGEQGMRIIFNAFVSAYNGFKNKDVLVGESYYNYLKTNNYQGYLDSVKKNVIIISLTSFPPRIGTVSQTIETLLNQTRQADSIILWLSESDFPNKEKDLPSELLEQTKTGLSIEWVKGNIGSYKKLVPALRRFPDNTIVTADDDVLYSPDWLQKLYAAYKAAPEMVHCYRAHKIRLKRGRLLSYNEWEHSIYYNKTRPSFLNFFTGVGGVLYPPNFLYKDVLCDDLFLSLAPKADDIWFWAMLVMNNIKINLVKSNQCKLKYIEGTQEKALWVENVDRGGNDVQLANVLNHYPEVMKRVKSEARKESHITCIRNIKMGIRIFFGRARRKVIRILLGKKLYNNLVDLNKTNEIVLRLNGRVNKLENQLKQNMGIIDQTFSRIGEENKVINKRTESVVEQIANQKSEMTSLNREIKTELLYKIQKYAPEDKQSEILADWYCEFMNSKLDLTNPRTFNEKIQWLKLYDSTPLKTRLADKFLVREWIKKEIGEEYLVPLLGVYNTFDEIDFDVLPDRFVLKANHGSAWNIIVKDKLKLDKEKAKKDMDYWIRTNFAYRVGLELQYRDIEPKIIAEQYLENLNGDLYDYKVFCFDGKAKYIMFLSERSIGLKMAFYDIEWNLQPFTYTYPRNDKVVPRPACLNKLIMLSEKLSKGFPHVRVDFFVLDDGSIRFGEMTFTSASGRCKWNPPEWDLILGDMIKLPIEKVVP